MLTQGDEIMPGMAAKVRFTAYNYRDYLPVDGILQRISADVVTDEQTRETAYVGQIEVAVNELMAQDILLYPGMPAEVLLTLNERSVVSYLFEPLLRSFNRALRES
ncbi:HlyD family secretion protein [Endozoicomonas sp. SCSIO W0465]|uniref:HlyD family secretion protein n=1 Tax=Endozoicomonas sp. SCSIO W0465 TaxID=2918516 RepID=UPI002075AC2B|nr:HlyD family secretion protein [Endozoicomonas sp. SCSIO W0465]USE34267.1 HlyD family secretion protein [Endozoicomonas sp. SCSIO W0465]